MPLALASRSSGSPSRFSRRTFARCGCSESMEAVSGSSRSVHSARFLVHSLARPGELDPLTARRGASWTDSPVYWTVFGVLLTLGLVASGFLLRAVGTGATASDGFASRAELTAVAGVEAAKRQAAITRPSLAPKEADRRKRRSAIRSASVARPRRVDLVASWETSLVLVASPGRRKDAARPRRILRQHPGTCLATATKPDLYEVGAKSREQLGRCSPSIRTGSPRPPTASWSPVVGCADSAVAERRAGALVPGRRRGGRSSFGELLPPFGDHRARRLPACRGPRRRDDRRRRHWAARPSDAGALRILSEHARRARRLGGRASTRTRRAPRRRRRG